MSNLIQFPNKRIQVDGVKNPLFVSDIYNANSSLYEGMKQLLGLGNTDFAILSGCEYDGINSYSAGIIYLNGEFYNCLPISAGDYAAGGTVGGISKPFSDNVSRETYNLYVAFGTPSSSPTTSPQFTGSMDEYRLNLDFLRQSITEEDWHYIGDVGEPAFGTGYAVSSPSYRQLRFKKDAFDYLVIEGTCIYTPGATSEIFTLPVGYRPSLIAQTPGVTVEGSLGLSTGYLYIDDSNGNVIPFFQNGYTGTPMVVINARVKID